MQCGLTASQRHFDILAGDVIDCRMMRLVESGRFAHVYRVALD
jgi:hypothetical protein